MNQTMQTDCDSTQRKLVLQALDIHKENIWSFFDDDLSNAAFAFL